MSAAESSIIINEILRCRPWIEAALEYSNGTHDFKDIVDAIFTGNMQLWPAKKGCLVTEITRYPKKKVLHIFLGGGDLETLTDEILPEVTDFAKQNDCVDVTLAGRQGWQRVLKNYGFKSNYVVLSRGVSYE